MLNIKKRIFIGSSSEALNVANAIKAELEKKKKFDCVVWEHLFDLTEETYRTLVKKVITFDFAIFIASPDDVVLKKKDCDIKTSARDNVFLEIGLFTGSLGKKRVYIMKHKDCSLATDLLGVTYVHYDDNIFEDDNISKCCKKMIDAMKSENKLHRMSLRPSVSLAIGYFESFILPVVNIISNPNAKLCIDKDNEYNLTNINKKINVIIPDVKNMDFIGWLKLFNENNNLKERSVKVTIGNQIVSRRVYISETFDNENLSIYDVPTTLNTAFKTIDMLVSAGDYIGISDDQIIVKKMEVADFYLTLQELIENNNEVKKYVCIKKSKGYKIANIVPYKKGL